MAASAGIKNDIAAHLYSVRVQIELRDLEAIECQADLEPHHTVFIIYDGKTDFRSKCEWRKHFLSSLRFSFSHACSSSSLIHLHSSGDDDEAAWTNLVCLFMSSTLCLKKFPPLYSL